MGKTNYGSLVKWAVIGGIGYFLIKAISGLADWWSDDIFGWDKNRDMAITKETTEEIWVQENQNIQKLLTFQEQYNTTEITNSGDLAKLQELKSQYEQNIRDFNVWIAEEQIKINEANFFISGTKSPLGFLPSLLDPNVQTALINAESQIIDSENKINYYKQQIQANQKWLNDVNLKISQLGNATTMQEIIDTNFNQAVDLEQPELFINDSGKVVIATPSEALAWNWTPYTQKAVTTQEEINYSVAEEQKIEEIAGAEFIADVPLPDANTLIGNFITVKGSEIIQWSKDKGLPAIFNLIDASFYPFYKDWFNSLTNEERSIIMGNPYEWSVTMLGYLNNVVAPATGRSPINVVL